MAEDIIIRYRAETDEYIKQLNVLIEKQEQLADEADRASKDISKSASDEITAAKKRQGAVEAELRNIQKLKESRARAFDVATIDRFNKAIRKSEDNIKSLTSATDKAADKVTSTFSAAGSQIKNIGLGIAAGFGAAFSIDAIVNFARQAVSGFLEAQEEAQKLEFSITSIGGESQEALERLTAQAEKLAEITYFDDDDIKRAQSALSAFGLTADQIEELVPKLVDFAVVTGQDVVSAAQQVGAGLEGAGREFKKYGIQVDAASTKAENLSKITEGLVKFQGAASDALKTQAGQIKDLNAEYGELQETIGGIILSKLGEFFTRVKQSLTPFADAVLGLAKALGIVSGEGSRLDGFGQIASKVFSNIGKAIEPVFTLLGNLINSLTEGIRYVQAFAQAFVVAFNEIGKTILNVGGGISDVIGGIFTFDSSQVKAGLDEIKGSVGKFGTDVKKAFTDAFGDGLGEVVKEQAKSVQAVVAQSEKLFTTDELRKKTLQELIALQKEYSKVQTNAGRQNLEAIEKELALKKAQYDKEVELRRKAQEERKKIDTQAFEEFKRNLFAEQDEVLRFLNETEKKAKERELLFEFEVRFKAATEGEDAALEFARQRLFETYQEELKSAELTSNTVEEANAKKQKAYEEYIANSEKLLGGFSIFEQNEAKNTSEAVQQTWIERNEELLRSSLDLFQQLGTLSNTFTQQRIEDLNLQLEKVREVEEEQLSDLEESKEKRLISESDYEKRSTAIKEQRIAAEKKIQAEISKQKRKQAVIEKASALFEIALNTAIAIMKVFAEVGPIAGIPLASLTAALGAAQAATVIAQPIPAFAKGTKGKKGSGMALVGEEGAEMTFLPDGAKVLPAKQTKTYGEVFDAMYDNRFEKYVMQKYVAPALEEQKRKYEGRKQESFASNIVSSMQYNGITTSDLLYANSKGTKVKNADEIAQAIAKALKTQSPDLWRM